MSFLTATEITALRTLRATYITLDADLIELTNFFKYYGFALSLDKTENMNRVMQIGLLTTTTETNAKLLKVFTTAKNYDLSAAVKAISDKAFTFQYDRSFDSLNFVLDPNFSFTPYDVSKYDTAKVLALNIVFGTPRV